MADMPAAAEEMLASLIGAWLVGAGADRDMLVDKAAVDLLDAGATAQSAGQQIERWWELLGELL